MKKLLLLLCCIGTLVLNAQYTLTYENSFRNWTPDQGWVFINNDTVSITPGLLSKSVTAGVPVAELEMLDNMLGTAHYPNWYGTPGNVPGVCDKIIISPPIALGNNPHAIFYSMHKPGSTFDVYVVTNPNDTTLNGLSANLLPCHIDGFNALNLNSYANTTVRLAFRLMGLHTYGLIDNLKVINKTGLATIPDPCFRSYLQSIVPGAFVGNDLDFLNPAVLNAPVISNPGSCIQSLEGIQHFPFLRYINLNNCQISYIPADPMYYLDSIKIKGNLLTYMPDMPMARNVILDNNVLTRIPNILNQYADSFTCINNSIFDCLQGTNRFVRGNFKGNVGVNFGTYHYYTMEYDYPLGSTNYGPVSCRDYWGTVQGKVYYDANQNGIYDASESILPNQRIDFVQSGDVFTKIDGKYGFYPDTGIINLNVTDIPSHFSCANPLTDTVKPGETIAHDFRIVTQSTVKDMGVNLTALNSPRTGDNLSLMITVENYGTLAGTGVVKMYLPTGYAAVINNNATIVNDTLLWPVTLQPFGVTTNIIQIQANYPALQTIPFKAILDYAGDVALANNTDTANVFIHDPADQFITWGNGFPYDPNNKIAHTPQVNAGFSDYLYYTINFENIGTGNASRVKVRDYLSSQLDAGTIELVGSSHPCSMLLPYDTIVDFVIYPITLKPKSVDSTQSHGHIIYRIKPHTAMVANEIIANVADIYFDAQPPIETNISLVWTGDLKADYTISSTVQCGAANIKFTDVSPGEIVSRQWIFQGGTPATSTAASPQVHYNSAGTYQVTLIVNAPEYTDTIIDLVNIQLGTTPSSVITASGPTSFCYGDSVTLTAPAGANYSYAWSSFFLPDTLTTQSILSKGGFYQLTVTDMNGCSATANQSINATQVVPIITNTANCQATVANLSTFSTYSSYLWSTGATTPTIAPSQYGQYYVTVTHSTGCTGKDTFDFAYHANPAPAINGPTTACNESGNYAILTVNQTYPAYEWSYNNQTGMGIAVPPGTYTVTVTDNFGCTGTASHTYTGLASTGVMLIGNKLICYGNTSTIQLSKGPLGGPDFTKYIWSTGDTTQNINVTKSGTYTVNAINTNGCLTTNDYSVTATDIYNVQANATDTSLCAGQTIQLNAQYSPGYQTGASGGCTAQTATLGTGTVQPSSTGFYNPGSQSKRTRYIYTAAELQATLGGPNLITAISLQVGTKSSTSPAQNLIIKMGNTAAMPELVQVYSNASFSSVLGWNQFTLNAPFYWDGVSDLAVEYCHYNPSGGTGTADKLMTTTTSYIATRMVSGSTSQCGVDFNGSTLSHPNIRFNYCPTPAVLVPFVNASVNWSSLTYSGANISTPTAANSSASTDSATVFKVIISDTNGCMSSDTVSFVPGTGIPVSINASKTYLCIGETAQLCAVSTATSYQWNSGSSASCLVVSTPGLYQVSVGDGSGCVVTASVNIQKTNVDSLSLQTTAQFCPTDSVLLCAPSGYATYQWSSGTATSCVQAKNAGSYILTVTDAQGCAGSDTVSVTAFPLAQLNISANKTALCVGDTASICATGGFNNYTWNTSATGLCISSSATGTYRVTATDGNGCSTQSNQLQIVQAAQPSTPVSVTASKTYLCVGDTAQLCVAASTGAYQWNNGSSAACLLVGAPGLYEVNTLDSSGCAATASVNIQKTSVDTFAMQAIAQFCPSDSVQLCAPSGFATYQWSSGVTGSCVHAKNAGNYIITVTDAQGCADSALIAVTQFSVTQLTITADKAVLCGNDTASICAAAGFSNYLWNTNATAQCIAATDTGLYKLTAKDVNGCSAQSNQIHISETPQPGLTASGNALSTSSGVSYQWYLNDTLITNATSQNYTATVTGIYKALVTDANGCGLYTDEMQIVVIGVITLNAGREIGIQVYPNPTPDKFNVVVETIYTGEVHFSITNMLGEVLFSKSELVAANKATTVFDLSEMAASIYFVNVQLNGESLIERLVKQ